MVIIIRASKHCCKLPQCEILTAVYVHYVHISFKSTITINSNIYFSLTCYNQKRL